VTEIEKQLHRDHAALAALLVPPPTAVEIGQIKSILSIHNEIEEGMVVSTRSSNRSPAMSSPR